MGRLFDTRWRSSGSQVSGRRSNSALTDQIRRSARSICSNIAEAWSKRRYITHFVSKLSDAEGEASETIPGPDFAVSCDYLDTDEHERLRNEYRKIRGGLITMMRNPDPWCGPSARREPDEAYELDEDDDLLGEF